MKEKQINKNNKSPQEKATIVLDLLDVRKDADEMLKEINSVIKKGNIDQYVWRYFAHMIISLSDKIFMYIAVIDFDKFCIFEMNINNKVITRNDAQFLYSKEETHNKIKSLENIQQISYFLLGHDGKFQIAYVY